MEFPYCLLEVPALRDQTDGLNPPASKLDAALALIFLLLDSSSNRLLDMEGPDGAEKIEEA